MYLKKSSFVSLIKTKVSYNINEGQSKDLMVDEMSPAYLFLTKS